MNYPMQAVQDQLTLDDLCAHLLAAKARAEEARRDVLEAEKLIADAVGVKDEGSFTVECDGYKVTTTQPVNRTVNKIAALEVQRRLPEDIASALFEWKPSLNVRLFKDLRTANPDYYREACHAVCSKPGKVSVKVEGVKE